MSRLSYIAIILFIAGALSAQLRVVKPPKTHPKRTTLALGSAYMRSVLYLNRNVKENNDARGIDFSAVYGGSRLIRVAFDYTIYRTINIAPTWYDVRAQTIEANVHFLARLPSKKAVFYPIFGLSYNIFSGYFTGINDNLNLVSVYQRNSSVSSRWIGINAGTGFEYYFKPFSVFVDYKMRVGMAEDADHLNIRDVAFSFGVRYNLRVPSIYKLFKGTRRRYFVDKDDSDW